MASYNRVMLLGNLTRDPEVRYVANGTAVTDLGLALNDKRKNASGEWIEEVVYVDVTLWGRTAEVAGECLTKGAAVLIEGRLKLDTWEKDGKKQSKLKVVGDTMQMLGGKPGAQSASTGSHQTPSTRKPHAAPRSEPGNAPLEELEIPF